MKKTVINAVIFDQDGLMFDTERMSARAWNQVGKEIGIQLEESFLCTVRGMNVTDFSRRFYQVYGDVTDFMEFRRKKQLCFAEILRAEGVPVKPGLKQLLAWLKSQNYKIAVATASTKEYTRQNLLEAGILDAVSCMVTGDMVTHAKPDPQVFLKAAEALGEKPEHCMVLEDSLNGVQAGLSGGFVTVMVPDLTQPDERMRSQVYRVCESLFEVKDLLEQIRGTEPLETR